MCSKYLICKFQVREKIIELNQKPLSAGINYYRYLSSNVAISEQFFTFDSLSD